MRGRFSRSLTVGTMMSVWFMGDGAKLIGKRGENKRQFSLS
jgi:hypothetical protein